MIDTNDGSWHDIETTGPIPLITGSSVLVEVTDGKVVGTALYRLFDTAEEVDRSNAWLNFDLVDQDRRDLGWTPTHWRHPKAG